MEEDNIVLGERDWEEELVNLFSANCFNEVEEKLKNEEGSHQRVMYAFVSVIRALLTEDLQDMSESISRLTKAIEAVEPNCHYTQQSTMSSFLSSWVRTLEKPTAKEMQNSCATQIIAFCSFLLSLLQLRKGLWISGFYNLRKSWKYYSECYDIIQTHGEQGLSPHYINDVYFGFGIFQIIISFVPPQFLYFVEAIGFKADRQRGMDYLKQCSNGIGLSSYCSHLFITALYLWPLQEVEKCLQSIEDTFKRYPNSVWSFYLAGHAQIVLGNTEKAKKYFIELHDHSSQLHQLQLCCIFELGSCAVKDGDWDTAVKYHQMFLDENKTQSYRCVSAFELGVSYCVLQNYPLARQNFQKAVAYARANFTFDQFAARKAKQYLDKMDGNPMGEFEMYYFINDARLAAGGAKEVIQNLSKVKELSLTKEEDYIMYKYLKGRCLKNLGNLDKAISCFETVLEHEQIVTVERYVIPYSVVELAKIYKDKGDIKKALELLDKACGYSGYDKDKPLIRFILLLKDRLLGNEY